MEDHVKISVTQESFRWEWTYTSYMLARQATRRTASLSNNSQTANRFVSTDLIMKTYDKDNHKIYGSLTFDRKRKKKCTYQWSSHAFRFTKLFSDFSL